MLGKGYEWTEVCRTSSITLAEAQSRAWLWSNAKRADTQPEADQKPGEAYQVGGTIYVQRSCLSCLYFVQETKSTVLIASSSKARRRPLQWLTKQVPSQLVVRMQEPCHPFKVQLDSETMPHALRNCLQEEHYWQECSQGSSSQFWEQASIVGSFQDDGFS